MTIVLHPAAAQDLADAARFYRREAGHRVAMRFLDEFDRVTQLLVQQPLIGTLLDAERRWFPLRGFPYSVVYRTAPDNGLRILIVRHQHRHPDHGSLRR